MKTNVQPSTLAYRQGGRYLAGLLACWNTKPTKRNRGIFHSKCDNTVNAISRWRPMMCTKTLSAYLIIHVAIDDPIADRDFPWYIPWRNHHGSSHNRVTISICLYNLTVRLSLVIYESIIMRLEMTPVQTMMWDEACKPKTRVEFDY